VPDGQYLFLLYANKSFLISDASPYHHVHKIK
jgi:hypothetical protein